MWRRFFFHSNSIAMNGIISNNVLRNPSISELPDAIDYMKTPEASPAIHMLRAHNIPFEIVTYDYVHKAGSKGSSVALKCSQHWIIKTLNFERRATGTLHCVLMHGDWSVDTEKLKKVIGAENDARPKKAVMLASEKYTEKMSGYKVGGTTPFGFRTEIPVYIEKSVVEGHTEQAKDVAESDRIRPQRVLINGGGRGLLLSMAVDDIVKVLKPTVVEVGYPTPPQKIKDVDALKKQNNT